VTKQPLFSFKADVILSGRMTFILFTSSASIVDLASLSKAARSSSVMVAIYFPQPFD
jgi:hypothetical protein